MLDLVEDAFEKVARAMGIPEYGDEEHPLRQTARHSEDTRAYTKDAIREAMERHGVTSQEGFADVIGVRSRQTAGKRLDDPGTLEAEEARRMCARLNVALDDLRYQPYMRPYAPGYYLDYPSPNDPPMGAETLTRLYGECLTTEQRQRITCIVREMVELNDLRQLNREVTSARLSRFYDGGEGSE